MDYLSKFQKLVKKYGFVKAVEIAKQSIELEQLIEEDDE